MRVRCIDDRPFLHPEAGRLVVEPRPGTLMDVTKGKVYEVIAVERGWYRIVDDSAEDYLYPPQLFEVLLNP